MIEFLKTQNLTHLAKETGLGRCTLSLIRSGKQFATQPTIIKIAEHLKKQGYTDTQILKIITTK
jgi:transcriptional regulator with XRE-family HTH domain